MDLNQQVAIANAVCGLFVEIAVPIMWDVL